MAAWAAYKFSPFDFDFNLKELTQSESSW